MNKRRLFFETTNHTNLTNFYFKNIEIHERNENFKI